MPPRSPWSWTASPRARRPRSSRCARGPASGAGLNSVGTWAAASDTAGTIARYEVRWRVDGTPWRPDDAVRLDPPGKPQDEARSHLRPPPAGAGRRRQLEPLGGERGLRTGPVPGHQPDPRPIGRLDALLPVVDVRRHVALLAHAGRLGHSARSRGVRSRSSARRAPGAARRGSTSTARWRRRSTSADPPPRTARSCSPAPGRRPGRTPSRSSCSARPAGRGWTWTPSSSSRRRDHAAARVAGPVAVEW